VPNEHVKVLEQARQRMVESRRDYAKTLAKPFKREETEDSRRGLLEVQQIIAAIDQAIEDEKKAA
jgi:hypothetical protein